MPAADGRQKGITLLLIALSGGTDEQRVAIADGLVSSGKESLAAYAMTSPSYRAPTGRARILRAVLDRAVHAAAETPASGLVIVHCLTEDEAVEVRAQGGVIWHVYTSPSRLVEIRKGDSIITTKGESFRHVLTPLDALSELVLPRLRSIAPLCAAAVDALAKA